MHSFDPKPIQQLNAQHTLTVLKSQSKIGRRVLCLLAYLANHGPQSQVELHMALPHGLRGELNAAYRHDYVAKREGKITLLPKGSEVVNWVSGYSKDEPRHWKQWEDSARLKQTLSKQPHPIINGTKHIRRA